MLRPKFNNLSRGLEGTDVAPTPETPGGDETLLLWWASLTVLMLLGSNSFGISSDLHGRKLWNNKINLVKRLA